jgi:hypothetical protein
MPLPGSIPVIRDASIVDFDQMDLNIVRQPASAKLTAWRAAEEAERRFLMYQWLAFYVSEPRNWRMFAELAGGFLLSFEVAVQHLVKALSPVVGGTAGSFWAWMEKHRDDPDNHGDPSLYNIEFRGLRLLRHILAHHEPLELSHSHGDDVVEQFHGPSGGRTARRHFKPITDAQYAKLTDAGKRALPQSLIGDWNTRAESNPAPRIMFEGLRRLKHLLLAAEEEASRRS